MYATTFADFEMMTMGAAVGAGSPMPVVCCLPPTETERPAAAARRQFSSAGSSQAPVLSMCRWE